MSTPIEHVADAVLLGSVGLKAWKAEHGCDQDRCSCSICEPLDRGLARLNEAIEEMGRWGE